LLQSGIVTINEVQYAQQTFDFRGHHKVGDGAYYSWKLLVK